MYIGVLECVIPWDAEAGSCSVPVFASVVRAATVAVVGKRVCTCDGSGRKFVAGAVGCLRRRSNVSPTHVNCATIQPLFSCTEPVCEYINR